MPEVLRMQSRQPNSDGSTKLVQKSSQTGSSVVFVQVVVIVMQHIKICRFPPLQVSNVQPKQHRLLPPKALLL
jgi:hypothetical protein